MLGLISNFGTLDVALIAAISLFAGLALRRWYALAWMVMAALVADFALPLIYWLISGDSWSLAWDSASRRFIDSSGGMLIWRTAFYFAAISAVFAIKLAWSRR
mgnify:CR=1 FL=1